MNKKSFPKEEYHVPFFDEEEYERKLCPKCGAHFWTQAPDMETCGEATREGCSLYTFIGDPPTKKPYSLRELREAFLSFFQRRGHKRLKPYPVVSRWRDDLYLTSASIVDFQPYVTNGLVPPPANPLVISQPCIRLVDVENTGPTFGRHMTFFEMGGHHAFNYPDKEIYWKDETVRYHHEFVTGELGMPSDEVVYKEDVWSGGGNAGPDLETIVRGLELATLVFMKFRVVDTKFVELPIRTVDTGYGMERYTWISQGVASGFHAIYGKTLDDIFKVVGLSNFDHKLLAEVAKFSGTFERGRSTDDEGTWRSAAESVGMTAMELSKTLEPLEKAFAIVDHTKSVAFMLAEGVVPSNVHEGYLTRLMIRRTYRLLKSFDVESRLSDVVKLQLDEWSRDFPYLREMQDEIREMLAVEIQKFEQTLRKGDALVVRLAQDLKSKGKQRVPTKTLLELYDSHGLPPEAVRESAAKEGIAVEHPEDFYRLVAELHLEAPPKELASDERLSLVSDLPETRLLYYENPYLTEVKSKVLRVLNHDQIVLDRTVFYPEGGGQPGDAGVFEFNDKKAVVIDVQKIGRTIVHVLEGKTPQEGKTVIGRIDWERRSSLMRAHTATHLVMGAARRVLGQHVWQTGAQKNVDRSRLDISHYKRLTPDEVHKIELLANQAVIDVIPVEVNWMPRDKAEADYGFRLYQGGAVPGKDIRVVKVGNWEAQACAGTHVKNTGEIGFIKLVHTERIQDGVERIGFSTGRHAVKFSQDQEELLNMLADTLGAPIEKLLPTAQRIMKEWKNARRENKRLIDELATLESGKESKKTAKITEIDDLKLVAQEFEPLDVDRMIKTAHKLTEKQKGTVAIFYGTKGETTRFVVTAGKQAVLEGVNAGEMAEGTAKMLGGGGSGNAAFAQGGGTESRKIKEALKKAETILRRQWAKNRNK
ncbi:MAG: alanine--tRNA ligase [Candidatus Bathyarchaeota archaeon]|nr:alanine--tRNA ligase [Candidatus Bathyarchaeota archaeon]